MSPAAENLTLVLFMAAVLLSLPVASVLTRQRRAALQAAVSVPPPLPSIPPLPVETPPQWITAEGPYAPPRAEIALPLLPVSRAPPQTVQRLWRRVDVWFALVLLVLMSVMLGPVFAGPQAMEGVELKFTSGLFVVQLIFHAAIVGLVVLYLRVFRKLRPLEVFGIGNAGPFKTAGMALAWILVAMFGIGLIGAALKPVMEAMSGGELKQQMLVEQAPQITDTATRVWMFLTLVAGAPLMEEIVFRGIFFSVAARYTHPVYAAVASGAFFAVIHNSLYALVPLTLLGIVLAWAYHKTRTLAVPILMHAMFNGAQFLLLFYGPPELRQ
jgi:membrane protease YdiL (CAAX protease family)